MSNLEREFEGEAVLFDLDGVLVDSTAAVERAWRSWAGRQGLEAEHILGIAHGRRTVETIRLAAPHLDAEFEALTLENLEAGNMDGVLEVEGARDLLTRLPEGSWTVVTSGSRKLATGRLEYFDLPLPEAFVTAEDVVSGKPAPEAYLKDAELLGVEPEGCVVLEDAPSGIRAARQAGMSTVALTTTYAPDKLAEADAVAGSLARIGFIVGECSKAGARKNASRLRLTVPD